jgi:hypothetical protein
MIEFRDQPVHQWYNLVASDDGQCTTWTKIILDVDYDERFPGHGYPNAMLFQTEASDGTIRRVKPAVDCFDYPAVGVDSSQRPNTV